MRQFSVLLLVALGVIVVFAGVVALLEETQLLTIGLNFFGPLLILVLGLWIVACAIECRRALRVSGDKG